MFREDGDDLPLQLNHHLAQLRREATGLEAERKSLGRRASIGLHYRIVLLHEAIFWLQERLREQGTVLPRERRAGTAPLPSALIWSYQRTLAHDLNQLAVASPGSQAAIVVPLADAYVQLTVTDIPLDETAQQLGPFTLVDLINAPQARCIIQGPVGSGKSVEVQRLALACAASIAGEPEGASDILGDWHDDVPVPILIDLRETARLLASEHGLTPIPPALANWLGLPVLAASTPLVLPEGFSAPAWLPIWACFAYQLWQRDLGTHDQALAKALAAGECLVLLDSLDDLSGVGIRPLMAESVQSFVARYPDNRYVVTCRTIGQLTLPDFICYTLRPLEEVQSQQLITRYLMALSRKDAATQAADLRGRLQLNDRLNNLASNPLMLALYVLAEHADLKLPLDRGFVYDRLLDLQLKCHGGPGGRNCAELLVDLAFEIQARADGDIPGSIPASEAERIVGAVIRAQGAPDDLIRAATTWLIDLVIRSGLLAPINSGYTMPDPLIREHLAARSLARSPAFAARAYAFHQSGHWNEALRLAFVESGRDHASSQAAEFLKNLLAGVADGPDPSKTLLLAAECVSEAPYMADSTALTTIRTGLLDLIGNPEHAIVDRVRGGRLLGMIGDPRFDDLLPPVVWVENGTFLLGSNIGTDDEHPPHLVDLPMYAIGVYPVTNREYARFLADRPNYPSPRYWLDPRFNNPSLPVVGVTWPDACAYTAWLTEKLRVAGLLPDGLVVRLPSEAEWEKAVSWDAVRRRKLRYSWGDQWDAKRANIERANTSDGRRTWLTTPVGCYPAGVSPYGLYDAIGNTWEWTLSEYANYPGATALFHRPGYYVLRGSSCVSSVANTHASYRSSLPMNYWRHHLGFRIVLGRPL